MALFFSFQSVHPARGLYPSGMRPRGPAHGAGITPHGRPGGPRRPAPGRGQPVEPAGFRLSREWAEELRATARPADREQTAAVVSRALEAFVEEEYAAAADLAARAKARAPRSGMVRELLGLALYREGRYREALAELLAFRRITGSLEQNHVIADCYRALGRPGRALEVCGEVTPALVSPQVWAEVLIVAASTHADGGELDEALATLVRADMDPGEVGQHHLRLWYVRADLLERAGRRAEAREVWERIVAEDPEFFDAAERLALH